MLRANKGRSIKGVGPKDRVSQSIYLVLETLQQAASSGDEWMIAHRPNVARRAIARCRLVARPRWYGQSGHRRGHDGALVSPRICSDLLRPVVWTSFIDHLVEQAEREVSVRASRWAETSNFHGFTILHYP